MATAVFLSDDVAVFGEVLADELLLAELLTFPGNLSDKLLRVSLILPAAKTQLKENILQSHYFTQNFLNECDE